MNLQSEAIDGVRELFSRIAELPPEQIDPVKGALIISRLEYPDLDESYYLGVLDNMGKRLKARISPQFNPYDIIEQMNRLIFIEEGFTGNTSHYFDPRNSFLNKVIDRKTGIPVTISLICMAVGRKADLKVHGFGMPGHFIIGLYHGPEPVFMDPFNMGQIFTASELASHDFARMDSKKILARILRNLKGIYRHMDKDLMVFQMIEWILALDPNSAVERKERGLIHEQTGNMEMAVRDLEAYLELNPAASDMEIIRQKINALKPMHTRLH